jgi:hypothetical protein
MATPHHDLREEVHGFFTGRMPDGWFSGTPEIQVDGEEVLVTGPLSEPDYPADASDATRETARAARIKRFREETREQRMRIADEAERLYGRKVSWGATCGDVRRLFTTVAVPVMTRLRMDERSVLDTLIESGVARSRSEGLAWCVRLVAKHEADWIKDLRDALVSVQKVRTEGPAAI